VTDLLPIHDPVLVFAIVATLILLAPIIMERWRLPGMIGLLLAGAVLGPNALGVLERDQSFVLLGTVGLLYIMFSAALEIDISVLKRYRVHSVVFGLLTFAIPMALGAVVSRLVLGFDWPASLLLASSFASHTLLTYPIASRLGITTNRAVTTAVGGTVITDTLALLVLAGVANSVRGQVDDYFWYRLAISLALYVALIQIGVPILARWFFRNLGRDGVSQFVFVLAIVFGCAALAHVAGAEPLVGAFLAGLALNRLIPHHGTLMNRIRFTGEAIFVPFFLLSLGMLLDVRVFAAGLYAWLVAVTMVVTVVLTKWLASESTRILLGYDRDQARLVFGLSVPHAAVTLAVTIVGYELGLFGDEVVNGAILMIFVTCCLAPVLVERHGRAIALAAADELPEVKPAQQRILVACSQLESARPLLELAVILHDREQQHPIYPLMVVEEGFNAADEVARAEDLLSNAIGQLAAAEVPAQSVTRIDINAASGILRARRELRATDVIIGWQGKKAPRERLFGSTLEHLARDRDYTLIVSRIVQPLNTCQRVVLALPPNIELEPGFASAAGLLANLTRQLGTSLLIIAEQDQEARLRVRLRPFKALVDFKFRPIERWTALRRAVTELTSEDDLLIVCGARPGSLAWEPLLTSLPTRLATRLPRTNVLAVYQPERTDDRDDDPATEIRL
jgi:Kef-type K+ transport system membrane component KefB/nucleotide-binding universal stress UspA family protein